MPFVRAYLRASTDDQDAGRARADLEQFVRERSLKVAAWYAENESGATLQRPELFRLITDASEGDILLVEQVDRLSRLKEGDWDKLKQHLAAKRIRVVALDLPTSWSALTGPVRGDDDDVTPLLLDAINRMLLDMLAAIARKDYKDRRRRQAQGIAKAQSEGRYRGRQPDLERHMQIAALLDAGHSWSAVCTMTKASRATVLRVVNARKRETEGHSVK